MDGKLQNKLGECSSIGCARQKIKSGAMRAEAEAWKARRP